VDGRDKPGHDAFRLLAPLSSRSDLSRQQRRAFAAGNIAVSDEAEQRSIELDRNATTCVDLLCAQGAG
jgi:hypothetical protein